MDQSKLELCLTLSDLCSLISAATYTVYALCNVLVPDMAFLVVFDVFKTGLIELLVRV